MICPSCNEHNHDDVRFCRHCGAGIERRTCDNGHTIPDGLSECPYCPRRAGSATTPDEPQPAPAAGPGTVLVSHTELQQSGVEPRAATSQTPAPPPRPAGRRSGTVVVMPEREGEAPAPEVQVPTGAVARSGATPLAGFVVSFSTDLNGLFWPLRYGRTRIGSGEDNDVVLSHPEISASHARIIVRDKDGTPKVWCEDCGSANGTRLNGEDIYNERPDLASADVLKVGPIELKLLLLD